MKTVVAVMVGAKLTWRVEDGGAVASGMRGKSGGEKTRLKTKI